MAYNALLQNSYIDIAEDLITTQELMDADIDEYTSLNNANHFSSLTSQTR